MIRRLTVSFQYQHNNVYRMYDILHTDIAGIKLVKNIPFLPIGFFKTQMVCTGEFEPGLVFESSGTTQTINSRHFLKDASLYTQSFNRAFELFYGPAQDWCILALLPAYLERQNSSLVMMAEELIKKSAHPQSGFYLYDHDKLAGVLQKLEAEGQKTILIGVTFALLDFAEHFPMPLKHTVIMETGGMKGRKEEMIREQVHALLNKAFNTKNIHRIWHDECFRRHTQRGQGYFIVRQDEVLIREEDIHSRLKRS